MKVTIANISESIPQEKFKAVVQAVERQCVRDFRKEWKKSGKLRAAALDLGTKPARIQGAHDAIIYVGDRSQDPRKGVQSALGYHSANHKRIPYGFVFLDIVKKSHQVWSATLSHEVLELLADPTAVETVPGPGPRKNQGTVQYYLEVCDPTQGDTYKIDGIPVSNFVTPGYFKLPRSKPHTNFLRLKLKPFGVRRSGYVQYVHGKRMSEVDGEILKGRLPAVKRLRRKMGVGRRNNRRAARIREN